jgi:hypothetical protein
MFSVMECYLITSPGIHCFVGDGQEHLHQFSIFQIWDNYKILWEVLAFMKTVFDLCFINDDLYLLNRIQSPAEHPPIIYY